MRKSLQAIRQRYRKQWQLWIQAELMQHVQLADDLKQQSDSSTKLY